MGNVDQFIGFAGYAVFREDGGGFGRRVLLGPRNYGVMDNYPGDPLPVVGTKFWSDPWVCLGLENREGENFCIWHILQVCGISELQLACRKLSEIC